MSARNDILSLLEWARDIGETHPFLDFHVHPFDVLSGDIAYQSNNQVDGILSRGSSIYTPPLLELEKKKNVIANSSSVQKMVISERSLLLMSRFLYVHTGPKVFTDQMELVGIKRALFLPVARVPGSASQMIEKAWNMFSKNDRFLLGCPFPVGMERDELACFFRSAQEKWNIQAIKIHPNLLGIDVTSKIGQELIGETLKIAGTLNIPIVVHGGRTPGLLPIETREFGILSRLKEVDWGISTAPVIIAHAGCYGLGEVEALPTLTVLNKMLEKHPNLLADTSNLEHSVLRLVLKKIDSKRLVFGSDALYVPVWKAWVSFLQALHETSADPESDLIRIASYNPALCLAPPTNC